MNLISRIQQYHTTLGVNSPAYRKLVATVFLTPQPFRSDACSEPVLQTLLQKFRENGIVQFDENYADLADLLVAKYFENPVVENRDLTSEDYLVNLHSPSDLQAGLASWIELSMLNPTLLKFFSNERLIKLVNDYYGRQAYYRNLPVLSETSVRDSSAQDATYKFHVDYGLKQVSFMLLLNDVSMDDTHMVYANGSHLKTLPHSMVSDRYSFDDEIVFSKYQLTHVVGKKGTLFIFDAGNGLHRAMPKPGTTRRILHMNMTTGHYMLIRKKVGARLQEAVSSLPTAVSRAFQRLI